MGSQNSGYGVRVLLLQLGVWDRCVGDAQLRGVKWCSLEWQNCPQVPLPGQYSLQPWQGRGLVPVSQLETRAVSNIPTPSQPPPEPGWVCDFDPPFGGGLPRRNHPAPSFPHPCSLFRSFHTLPWSRTSSCRLSSVVNPSRWEASGGDSSCIFPLLFTRCFN